MDSRLFVTRGASLREATGEQMSDERELQEQEVPGVGEGVEEPTAQPTAEETDKRQPEQVKPEAKVNLDEFEEFRQWKSQQDRRLAEMERNYQQQLYDYQQQLEQRETAEMDDYQRAEYERQKLERQNQMLMQRLQEQEVQAAKHQALNEVSNTMGVPLDALMEATDINDAWRRAARYTQTQQQQRAAEVAAAAQAKAAAKAEKQQRNTVDVGGGAATTEMNQWESTFRSAKTAQDLAKLLIPQRE